MVETPTVFKRIHQDIFVNFYRNLVFTIKIKLSNSIKI